MSLTVPNPGTSWRTARCWIYQEKPNHEPLLPDRDPPFYPGHHRFRFAPEDSQGCHELSADRSITVQYVDRIGGLLSGYFGDSTWFNAPVMTESHQSIPRTLKLAEPVPASQDLK